MVDIHYPCLRHRRLERLRRNLTEPSTSVYIVRTVVNEFCRYGFQRIDMGPTRWAQMACGFVYPSGFHVGSRWGPVGAHAMWGPGGALLFPCTVVHVKTASPSRWAGTLRGPQGAPVKAIKFNG